MRHIILFLLVVISSNLYANKELTSILKLIIPQNTKAKTSLKRFDNSGCKTDEMKLFLFLTMKQAYTQTYKFSKKCQIQGNFTPKYQKFFNVNLALRNFYDYKVLKMKSRIVLDTNMILRIDVKDAVLQGSKKVEFSGFYKGKIAFGEKGVEFNKLGGELNINKIDSKKVSIKKKI